MELRDNNDNPEGLLLVLASFNLQHNYIKY